MRIKLLSFAFKSNSIILFIIILYGLSALVLFIRENFKLLGLPAGDRTWNGIYDLSRNHLLKRLFNLRFVVIFVFMYKPLCERGMFGSFQIVFFLVKMEIRNYTTAVLQLLHFYLVPILDVHELK